ncbi:MAG: dTMP kinase [Clostridiales bacterium]|nr:dTMP kinase [Clostridiales bacterium]
MKGKLIVIEGTDCSGKETQANSLVDFLNQNGYMSIKCAFPNYNSPTGKIIAGAYLGKEGYMDPVFDEGATNVDPYCASLLYAMDRKYNIKQIIEYLNEGYNVVLDRYVASNMAHQGAKYEGTERKKFLDFVDKLEYGLLNLPKPDLSLFLHMPIWASKLLKADRAERPDQHEQAENYLSKSEETYLEIIKMQSFITIECTDGDRIKSISEIKDLVCKRVIDFLKK